MAKGEKYLPLTVWDEHSRYLLAIETPEKGDTAHIKAVFELLFRRYGLPRIRQRPAVWQCVQSVGIKPSFGMVYESSIPASFKLWL
jgi:hypothetical protein